ncbi:MAG: serine--tRNA ligase [Candidatus Cloacimonadota bacterium]|nr:MAG: serine--tRNA ligase [Candidatus Cloacimonadota bacterium]
MVDIKLIRSQPDMVAEAVKNKGEKADIKAVLRLDEELKKKKFYFETLRAEQNRVSKEIPKLKKAKEDTTEIMAKMKEIAAKVKSFSTEISELENKLNEELLKVPNIPQKDIPTGDESHNLMLEEWGTKKEFSFKLKEQSELLESKGLVDFRRGSGITGSGFPVYVDRGALLERALINYMLDKHIYEHGYTELKVPFIVNRKTMTGTGQLPKLEDDMYRINEDDFFLIPTAEVPVTNFYAGEILKEKDLPARFVSYTPCFRREAGSYGKDTKGLQRLHQFNKVEMVRFVKPEDSDAVLDEMVKDAASILEDFGIHYRTVKLATGDLSFASAKTIDLEAWAPGTGKYLEVSSVSNFEDFQARRAGIRFRDSDGKVKFVHTLNGSGLAAPRTMIIILEQYQNEDGSITVPEVLRPYLRNLEKI